MSNGTSYSIMQSYYYYLNDDISDPRTKTWPMVGSPMAIIFIISGYLYFIRKLGPKFMKHRKPFNTEKLMMAYNFVQISICSFIVLEIIRTYFVRLRPNMLCDPVDVSNSPNSVYNAYIVGAYFAAKILELMDTVFFVLRKKWNQITALHLYHHSGMVFVGWVAVKYVPGGQSMLTLCLNSLVHVVMYVYYLLMSLNPDLRQSIWWKKHITQMQLVQFLIILIHHLFAFAIDCGYPRAVSAWVFPHICFIALLFLDFYMKAYTEHATKATELEEDHRRTKKVTSVEQDENRKQTNNGMELKVKLT